MNNAPTSPAPDGAIFTNQAIDLLDTHRDNLRRVLAYRAVDTEEVECVLGVYVADLKERGRSPEAVVIAVKKLLAEQERQITDGQDAAEAVPAARDHSEVHSAIVTLAIAQYYGIRLHATDIAHATHNVDAINRD